MRGQRFLGLTLFLGLPLLTSLSAQTDSEVLEYEGNSYQLIDKWLYWEEAKAACEEWNGHLVTVNSSGEDEFIFDNFIAPGGLPWLGGTDEGSEGDWRWVTGEPFSYTNWWPGQPDNYCESGGCENYLAFGNHMIDAWWDQENQAKTFICEWDTEPAERILSFAQFGTGGGLQFDLVLVNPNSAVTATGAVRFWDPNGNQVDSSSFLPGGVDFELPPRGTRTFSTTGTGDVVTGSITVHANLPIAGVVRFFLPNAGLAGVGSSEAQGAVIVPVRREGNLSSGVAIRNAWNEAITVDLTLKDEEGQEVVSGTAVRDIPINGRVSEFIHEYFPEADTTSFKGSVLIEVRRGKAAVIGLELEVGGQNPSFTTLPVGVMTHKESRPDLTPRCPEGWSSKVVVSKTTGTSTNSLELTSEDDLYVDYAVLNHGKVAMMKTFQTDLLIDDALFASDNTEPPLEAGEWVYWRDRSIGKLSAGTHTITVFVHGVPGSGDFTNSVYTRFITVSPKEDGRYNGTWSGTTEQQRPLSFEVEDGEVTLVTIDVRVQGTSCTATITGGVKITPGAPVLDDSFVWSVTDPSGSSTTLSGTFSSLTAASGTLKVTSQNCNGTLETNWSATKD
jgi:hypothetical protein